MADISKLEQMLKEIKSHRTPPEKENDPYFCRYPWNKLGAYFDGYGWFKNEIIISQATEKDIQIAYDEIMGVNKCQS